MLNGMDSGVDRDGSVFHGAVVDSVSAGDKIIVHSESEVRGILVLLRSKNHPEGFRYELLLTSVTDHAKTYDMTASLNPSFFDASATSAPVSKADTQRELGRERRQRCESAFLLAQLSDNFLKASLRKNPLERICKKIDHASLPATLR